MNRPLPYLATLGVVLLVSSFTSNSLAQTASTIPSAVALISKDRAVVLRPTLKSRQPTEDSLARNEDTHAEKANCEPQAREAAPLFQRPIRIEFEGLHAVNEAEVIKAFREQQPGVIVGLLPDSKAIEKAVAILEALLDDQGYCRNTVDVVQNEVSNSIKFVVSEGARLPIAGIRFEGNRIFSSEQLTSRIDQCLVAFSNTQSAYDRDVLDYCQRRLTNFVRSQGYLQAKLEEPRRSANEDGVVVTIPVREGALYRLGDVKIEGAPSPVTNEIKMLLPTAKGDVANGEVIGKWLYEDVRRLYGEKGFIEFTAELSPTFRSNPRRAGAGIIDLSITIDEGTRFRLRSVNFIGDDVPEWELRDLFLVRDGDIFDQQLFEESIKRLNEMGWLDPLDVDKDVDYKRSGEEGLVAIIINVRKRRN